MAKKKSKKDKVKSFPAPERAVVRSEDSEDEEEFEDEELASLKVVRERGV